ncbi:hypothetical protein E5Q_03322 [Mixia osmundae IAM 14324]|uniref:Splicing factor 3B subunit 4 n=1 Tax=Mixia osmundae (strain CBS 9802 / IAM 14324 / JCM 22182 / KY 12970) TaxID=764103 RepID=G7E1E1_MIXOS|nr:hypothetical protein E5Q_03322 [Mixia osmundae IAM 14324]
MSARPPDADRNQEATIYMGNLDERVTDALVWELMLQCGPIGNVHLPKDRVSMAHQGYGFCEFQNEEDAEYAVKIMNQIKLFGKPIRVNKASSDRKQVDIGANLFIGNLDPAVDERLLYDAFSNFGTMTNTAYIPRETGTGASRGHGFISFDTFEASDAAIEAMNNQYLMNKPITVQYAFKKDTKGERHGSAAERLLAAQAQKNSLIQPGGPRTAMGMPPPPPPIPAGFQAQAPTPQFAQPPPPPGFGQYPAGFAPPPAGFAPPPAGFGQPAYGY